MYIEKAAKISPKTTQIIDFDTKIASSLGSNQGVKKLIEHCHEVVENRDEIIFQAYIEKLMPQKFKIQ